MLLSGIVLAVAGFVVDPVGEMSDSVLWYVSQSLLYAGSVFGLSAYVENKLKKFNKMNEMNEFNKFNEFNKMNEFNEFTPDGVNGGSKQ